MNNFMISAKRFFTNKNTVTIIGVIIILVILYSGYNATVNNAIRAISVPTASRTIPPQTQIVPSDIRWETVQGALAGNVMTSEAQIVGMYTNVAVTIPRGSMFYIVDGNDAPMLVRREDLPGSWLRLLQVGPDGNTDIPYFLAVNLVTTFANSIQPGMHIDLFMRARDPDSHLIMFGRLIEHIEVLAVKDGSGENVFGTNEIGTPAFLYFGVMDELHLLLRKALYLGALGVELIVVPHGGANMMNITGDTEVTSEYLRDFIEAHTLRVPTNNEWLEMNPPEDW